MKVEELVALLPPDGEWLPKSRLLARVSGFVGHPVSPMEVSRVLSHARRRGVIDVEAHKVSIRGGVVVSFRRAPRLVRGIPEEKLPSVALALRDMRREVMA